MLGFLRRLLGLNPTVPAHYRQRHDMPMHDMVTGNEDIVTGYRFCATMQRRTPLSVLKQHGRVVPRTSDGPPTITEEMWEGIWVPDLGDGILDGIGMASEVGHIDSDGGDYLAFLIALRTITEGPGTIADKEAALKALAKDTGPGGTPYRKFHTAKELVEDALPRSIHLLPVSSPVRQALLDAGLNTLGKVDKASDKELLAIKGLGPKSLTAIRAFLATTPADKHALRYLADAYGSRPSQCG